MSVSVYYAPVVVARKQRLFPLIFSHIIDLSKNLYKTYYYISGEYLLRNSTYAVWMQLDAQDKRGFYSQIFYRTSLLTRNSKLQYALTVVYTFISISYIDPQDGVSALSVWNRTPISMSLEWKVPSRESLNDDTGIFFYRITWQSELNTASGDFDYYSDRTSPNRSLGDRYTVRDLQPANLYELCMYIATIDRQNGNVLLGPSQCVNSSTDFLSKSYSTDAFLYYSIYIYYLLVIFIYNRSRLYSICVCY